MSKSFYFVRSEDNRNIIFQLKPIAAEEDIPEEQSNLVFDIENSNLIIQMIFVDDDRKFNFYFHQLLSIARIGLVGKDDYVQTKTAHRALTQLKEEIVSKESGKIKNKYLKKLGTASLRLGLPTAILASLIHYIFLNSNICIIVSSTDIQIFEAFLLLWSGCMVGVWLTFAITRNVLKFEDLHILEADRLEPRIRLIFTGILCLTFGLLFFLKIIVVQLGSFSTDQVFENAIGALCLGILLGINEKALGTNLSQRASKIISN